MNASDFDHSDMSPTGGRLLITGSAGVLDSYSCTGLPGQRIQEIVIRAQQKNAVVENAVGWV